MWTAVRSHTDRIDMHERAAARGGASAHQDPAPALRRVRAEREGGRYAMGKEERYDVVIIGGGHNGTTTAAYLAKCGLSVCVLEERPECGGAQETVEPIFSRP